MTKMQHHDIKNLKEGENSNIRLKVKWEKVDIDLYKALTDHTLSLGFAEYLAFTVVLFVAASFMIVHIFSVKCSVSFNVLVVLFKKSRIY
jgi:hypothetical protein